MENLKEQLKHLGFHIWTGTLKNTETKFSNENIFTVSFRQAQLQFYTIKFTDLKHSEDECLIFMSHTSATIG